MNAVITLRFTALLTLCAILIPLSAQAIGGETSFGGTQVLIFDESTCSCSQTNVHFIRTSEGMVKLYDDHSGTFYRNGNVNNIGGSQLGTYRPGAQPCEAGERPYCYTVATPDGVYGNAPGTGLSFNKTLQHLLGSITVL